MTNDSSTSNTALDQMSSMVSDADLPPENTPEQEAQRRLDTVKRGLGALSMLNERLLMIERAFGSMFPEVVKEQPLGDAVDLLSEFKVLMDQIGGDGGSVSAVKKRLDYMREVTMPERLDAEKVKTFNTEKFRVTKTIKIRASVNPDGGYYTEGEFAGQPKAWEWLRENGLESLIKPTVNASSLSAAAKEAIENGSEFPEELFKVHPQPSVSITKKR